MNAKDLMIGDWVRTFLGECGRVTSIDIFQHTSNSIDVFGKTYDEDRIEAVLLTEEILKANGFEDKSDKARYGNVFYGLEHGNTSVTFEVDNGLPILTIEDAADRSKQHNVICLKDEVYNVHELQHALRLYGLNKMADNFKIERYGCSKRI